MRNDENKIKSIWELHFYPIGIYTYAIFSVLSFFLPPLKKILYRYKQVDNDTKSVGIMALTVSAFSCIICVLVIGDIGLLFYICIFVASLIGCYLSLIVIHDWICNSEKAKRQ